RDRVLPHVLEKYGWGAHGCSLIVLFVKEAKNCRDTAGQERFHTITTSYYRGAMGIVVVYDITDEESFDNIAKWLRYIELHANEDVQKILLANKCDVIDGRAVSSERGEKIAKAHGIRFLETSARSNINIQKAFGDLAEAILNKVIVVLVFQKSLHLNGLSFCGRHMNWQYT
uniref:Uncharacterized protein n=1 Tax=Parascaris univalens TaxID=6257 RepID=A0A915A3Z1_PARUN